MENISYSLLFFGYIGPGSQGLSEDKTTTNCETHQFVSITGWHDRHPGGRS